MAREKKLIKNVNENYPWLSNLSFYLICYFSNRGRSIAKKNSILYLQMYTCYKYRIKIINVVFSIRYMIQVFDLNVFQMSIKIR